MPADSSPPSTASAKSVLTRKSLTLSAPTSQRNLADARSARWPTASPDKISTGAKTASRLPARLTKTLPADAPAAAEAAPAAAAEDAEAAEEGPAPADDMVGVLGSSREGRFADDTLEHTQSAKES